jgi:serine/threonine protein kinase
MDGAQIEHRFEPGALVANRYEIRSMIGKGGMGQVFKVLDHKTETEVALKTLHPKYTSNKHAVARFVREVKLARQLNHPGIVKIFDAQQWNGTLFYTMEFLDGKSLRQWIRQKHRLDFGSTVRVLCLVAEALDHAHQITIHRDLSPENIMVLPDGSIRILDFGLAKLDDKFKGLTTIGINLGKIHYMSPEQEQDASVVDHRADLYSMGVMFYEMLAGRSPRMMTDAAKQGQEAFLDVLAGRAAPPIMKITDIRSDLPPEANDFVEKALARKPEDRFSSAAEFRAELLKLYRIYREREAAAAAAVIAQEQARAAALANPSLLRRLRSFFAKILRRG